MNIRKSDTLDTLYVGAMRYYLGRTLYAVGDFCELLAENWKLLPKPTRDRIRREVEEEFEKDDRDRETNCDIKTLGHDCDRLSWELVRKLWKK